MGRKKLKNELSDYVKETLWLSGFLEASNLTANIYFGYDNDYLWPLIAGFGYTAFRRWLDSRPVASIANFQVSAGRMSGSRAIRVNGKKTIFASTVQMFNTKKIKYREPRPQSEGEHYWRVKIPQRHNPVEIAETELLRFCQVAYNRQLNGEVHPMSRPYFLSHRWKFKSYEACISVLDLSGVIINRHQGTSGELAHPPGMAVRHCRYMYPA